MSCLSRQVSSPSTEGKQPSNLARSIWLTTNRSLVILVYLKGKPKYVTIYKSAPKPKPKPSTTPAPVVKPTTVYHMPVYSP